LKVYFIGAGPGDVELMTIKGHKRLHACSYVMHAGSLINPEIIEALPESAKIHDTSKLNLEEQVAIYKEAEEANQDVARLQSGDLSIYGAIAEQMRALDELGIQYEIIPGVSSVAASAATLQNELTLPEISQTVIFSRISGRTEVPPDEDLEKLASHKCTLCLFLSIHKIKDVAKKLSIHYPIETPVIVVYKASWKDEKIIRGNMETIAEKVEAEGIRLTALILVGAVFDKKDFRDSRLYSKEYSHLFRKKNVGSK
jgi:precorrin-4/cobalt-precorrin-4 C11-methyltransferase